MNTKDLFSLKGRVALITGGSRGIGKMIAAGFIAQGAKVYISARKADACNATAKELSKDGGTCISIPMNVATVAGAKGLAAAVMAQEPKVDIAEEFVEGTTVECSNSERDDSECDEWKEFDEEVEAGCFDNLSESDRLSELDDMLESDDLAADAYEAEGWQNRLSFFRIQMTQATRIFFFRKRIFN